MDSFVSWQIAESGLDELVCVECGHVFSQPKRYMETHGLDTPPYELFNICPNCGGAFVRAKRCDCCGEVITGEYIKVNDGRCYCDDCCLKYDIADDLI